uniref:Retrotransposon protein, putative, unclassified n=1 Tax=Oryza sativa subsp. japonica TaxID=39947 RepID=Q2QPQ6_ORYSJ|nr:retrotransposon protein, putative, unclassified [Oryza sativa Japonica Group]
MAENQSPSTVKPPNPPGTKHPSSEVGAKNIVPITIDKLSPEQRQEFERMMSSVQDKFMNSFKETLSGTIIQKYKLKVVAADEPGTSSSKHGKAKGSADNSSDKGGEPRDGEVEDVEEEDAEEQEPLKFNNFQDQVDYVVQHALINQSGVLVNTLTNMIKSMVHGTIAEHQNKGLVFLLDGVFPQYRNLVTGNQQHTANAPPVQPTTSVSAPAPGAPSSVQRQSTPIGQQVVQLVRQQTVQQIPARQRTPIAQQNQPIGAQFVPEQQMYNVQQPPENYLGWAYLEKQFHSYFYSGTHEMKLSVLTAVRQRHDETVQDYIQRFRDMRNKCYSLALTDSQLADLTFQGLIAPIKEKFSSQEFESLSHLAQKVTLHKQRFAEAKKNFKKINHAYPYMYDSEEEDDSEVAAAEWARSKKVVPCQWVKNSGKEERYGFDITKADKIFDLLLQEKQIQLPAGNIIPSAEELGKRKYCKWHKSNSHATNDCKVFRQQICRNMNSAIIKGGSARDLKVDGCGDKGFRQVQALSMRGNTLLLFGDLNPLGVY